MRKLQYNAPVILTFVLLSAAALLLNTLTGGITNHQLFSVYRSSWLDPFAYVRLFLHVLGHSNFQHFSGNILMILILGPMVEERYGSRNTLILIAVTALTTGVMHCILSPGIALLGASGVVFMLIFLASLSGMRQNRIPLTLLLVAIVYFGQEIYGGLFTPSNISHLTHIIGGCCGVVLGFLMRRR
ncbi:MAG: rhomboid family intrarane serine protease [Firmicutes bacterium]|nr:rhomboid family intrarane serine protease [Bacillota bacterium]